MSLNDSIKIVNLLKAQIKACEQLATDSLEFSLDDYERALAVVLEADKAHNNEQWGH
jgi:aromatic ring-opening dioxygenase LigB subunit